MMKKYILLFVLVFIFTACVQLKSVADKSERITPYTNLLVVIPYDWDTEIFSDRLKKKIEEKFGAENKKVDVMLLENEKDKLVLNESSEKDAKINAFIAKNSKDLVLIFRPSHLGFSNGALQKVEYIVTGIDTKTKKEIWKGEFIINSTFGPAAYAKKTVQKIYDQLKLDKVI